MYDWVPVAGTQLTLSEDAPINNKTKTLVFARYSMVQPIREVASVHNGKAGSARGKCHVTVATFSSKLW